MNQATVFKEKMSLPLQTWKTSLLQFIYPPNCLHCGAEALRDQSSILCSDCSIQLSLLEAEDRCRYCFSTTCKAKQCPIFGSPIVQLASALEYMGAAATLIKTLKYEKQWYLAKGLGSYLVAQFFALSWPLPDYIIPVPQNIFHWIDRGISPTKELAMILSQALDVPLISKLKRSLQNFSQTHLSLEQRTQLHEDAFSIGSELGLKDKIVLLIDDVATSTATLKVCANALHKCHTKQIYALTVCRAEYREEKKS